MNDLNSRYFSKFTGDQIDEAISLVYALEDENTFFKGVFISSDSTLLNNIPNPKLGNYAYLGTSLQTLTVYNYDGSRWVSSGNTVDISGYNIPVQVRGESESLTISQKTISKGLNNIEGNTGIYKVFQNYSLTQTYTKGSYVIYEGIIYKSNSDTISGDFDNTKWDLTNIIEYLIDQSSKTLVGIQDFNNLKTSVDNLESLLNIEDNNKLKIDDRGHLIHIYDPSYPMDFVILNGHLMLKEYL